MLLVLWCLMKKRKEWSVQTFILFCSAAQGTPDHCAGHSYPAPSSLASAKHMWVSWNQGIFFLVDIPEKSALASKNHQSFLNFKEKTLSHNSLPASLWKGKVDLFWICPGSELLTWKCFFYWEKQSQIWKSRQCPHTHRTPITPRTHHHATRWRAWSKMIHRYFPS